MDKDQARLHPLATLSGHRGAVCSVDFSPDGETLASASVDGTIKLWGWRTHEESRTIEVGQKMKCVAFSPNGKLLAATDSGGRLTLFSVPTGRVLWAKTKKPAGDCETCAVFSPDGKTVAASQLEAIRLFAVETGEERVLSGEESTVCSLAFSSDGATLVSASIETGTIKLWDTKSRRVKRVLKGHVVHHQDEEYNLNVWAADLSPDGRTVASGSEDGAIKLWDAETGVEVATLTGHEFTVFDLTFSPDGSFLLSCSSDQTIRLWDIRAAGQLASVVVSEDPHQHGAYGVAFSPSGRQLAAACSDGNVLLWGWDGPQRTATP